MALPIPPSPNMPITGKDGQINVAWDRWFNTLQQVLTGSGGNVLPTTAGGTGQSSYTNGQILIGDGVNDTLVKTTLSQGANIAIANGQGSITISLSGIIAPNVGGTGVNNGSSTITLGGPIQFTGSYPFIADLQAATEVTFPTSGTLAVVNSAGMSGTVTSVTLTGDGTILSSTPSTAVTTSGTLTATLATQTKNTVLAGPNIGSATTPTFRRLTQTDLPTAGIYEYSFFGAV